MYYCNQCNTIKEELELVRQYYSPKDYERLYNYQCQCGGELLEAETCSLCQKIVAKENLKNQLCERCQKETKKEFVFEVTTKFNENQLLYLFENMHI